MISNASLNESFSCSSGIVPNQLKIARVIPIFKSGDKSSFSNYRLVSVLPAFSNILEGVIYNRLLDYLIKHKIHVTQLNML